jgi:16S rRNA processing protein RimM
MATETPFPFTILAEILRPQGRRGELLCQLLTDFPEKFDERKKLFLFASADVDANCADRAREIALEDFWMPQGRNAGRIVLKFSGCDSIDEAEQLSRLQVGVPREQRASLDDDQFFVGDLIGCELVTENGLIGRVEDVDTAGAASPLLIVRDHSNAEILVPLVKAYLRNVDVNSRKIEMTLPDGLLEINRKD